MEKILKQLTFIRLFKIQIVLYIFGIKVSRGKIRNIIYLQQIKGFEKYGKYITECKYQDYNWETMAIEEIADFLIYILKKENQL